GITDREGPQWVDSRGSIAVHRMTGSGAKRKHVTLPRDFRSPPENGHSRYGSRTARFAPEPSFSKAPEGASALKQSVGRLRCHAERVGRPRAARCRPLPAG